jgi:hypothetical protein
MAAVRESMRSPLEESGDGKDERVILGTLPPDDKRKAKPGRLGVALAAIFAVIVMIILFVLVPMFWDVLGR